MDDSLYQDMNIVLHESVVQTIKGKSYFFFFSFQKGSTQVAPDHSISGESLDKTNLGFIHAFVAAISVIIVSELGDKTFFIAAIMAMRYNRLTVLAGAMLALGLMTCLSGQCLEFSVLKVMYFLAAG